MDENQETKIEPEKEFTLFNDFINTFLIEKKSFIIDDEDIGFEESDIDNCLETIKSVNTMPELKGVFFEKNQEGKIVEKSSITNDQKKHYLLLWHCYYIMYVMYKTSKSFLGNVGKFKAKDDIFLDDSNRVASTKQVYSREPIRPFRVLLNIFKTIWEQHEKQGSINGKNEDGVDSAKGVKAAIKELYNTDDKNRENEDRIKNILLYLCDPDNHLPIISQSHKKNIEKYLGFLLDDNHGSGEANTKEIVKQISDKLNEIIRSADDSAEGGDNKGHKEGDRDLYDSLIRCFWDSQSINTNSDKNDNLDVETLLRFKKAVVLYGPPGTSKTYSARTLAKSLICKEFANILKAENTQSKKIYFKEFIKQFAGGDEENNIFKKHIHKLQLHANYTYEDFIAGKTIDNNRVITQEGYLLKLIDEIDTEKNETDSFKKLCSNLPHILILDEINRVDISRIFGELFTAMEPSYRKEGGIKLTLFDSDKKSLILNVPENLYFIGTMNLIDFSLEQVDFALRRRFAWVESTFDKDRLQSIILEKVKTVEDKVRIIIDENIDDYVSSCEAINLEIKNETNLGEKFWIGHTFFAEIVDILTETNINDFKKAKEFLWSISLRPMLEAYCGTMDDRKQKEFIDNCRNSFMSQDAIEQNNNNKNNL